MTDAAKSPSFFNPFPWIDASMFGAGRSIVSGGVTQPILPGWTFGNVIVNEKNSSSPSTERDIVAEESYGRQIGKLLEAVCAMIEAQGGPGNVTAFKDVIALQAKVEKIKNTAAADRLGQIGRDLARLKEKDKPAYEDAVEKIRSFLPSDTRGSS